MQRKTRSICENRLEKVIKNSKKEYYSKMYTFTSGKIAIWKS